MTTMHAHDAAEMQRCIDNRLAPQMQACAKACRRCDASCSRMAQAG